MMNTKTETFNGVYIGEGKVCERDRERGSFSEMEKKKNQNTSLALFLSSHMEQQMMNYSRCLGDE